MQLTNYQNNREIVDSMLNSRKVLEFRTIKDQIETVIKITYSMIGTVADITGVCSIYQNNFLLEAGIWRIVNFLSSSATWLFKEFISFCASALANWSF